MYRANRSPLAVLGALTLVLSVPAAVLAQETDPQEAAKPGVEEKSEELQEAPAEMPETTKAETRGEAEASTSDNLMAVAKDQGNLTRFVTLVEETGLSAELSEGGPYTIFAPTDDALAALEQEGMEPADPAELRRVVRTHITVGEWTSQELAGANSITNLLADDLTLNWTRESSESGSVRQVEGSNVIKADIDASNGVIHEVDAVLSTSPAPEASARMEERQDTEAEEPASEGTEEQPGSAASDAEDSGAGS